VRINASIFAADPLNLEHELGRASTADFIHVDVMDNHFVPNMSFGLHTVSRIADASPVPLDVHLMIEDPENWIEQLAVPNVAVVTFHAEATPKPVELSRSIRALGLKAGLALRPETSIDAFVNYLCEFDQILVMTIEPGRGGQSLVPATLEKVALLRSAIDQSGCKVWLQVDGGINRSTIRLASDAGADTFVAGSAIFGRGGPDARIAELREAVDRGN